MAATTTGPLATRLHHHAYVVRDQEATRRFYEEILGFPLTATWCEVENVRGKERTYCHTFFSLGDGSALAFFQFADPVDAAELALDTGDSLNHVALATDAAGQEELVRRLDAAGIAHRTVEHGYCTSLYVSDPDGLTVEFTVDAADVEEIDARQRATAHHELQRWLAGDHTPNNDIRSGPVG